MKTSQPHQYNLWHTAADRRYFCGFTGSAGFVLQSLDLQGSCTLITDGRYAAQAREQCADQADVQIASDLSEPLMVLTQPGDTIWFDQNHFSYGQIHSLQQALHQRYLIPLGQDAGRQRACKTPDEVAAVRHACTIAEEGLQEVLEQLLEEKFATEIDVRQALEAALRQRGSTVMPFDFIVAQGKRSALPHGVASERPLGKEPITIDWGAEWQGYFSDQTVTIVPDQRQWSARWQEIYDLVYAAQQAAMQAVRADVPVAEIDRAARSVIEAGGYGERFVHSTGHGVGLEIHEYPGISARVDAVLKPGMIITIEPGIYIPDFGGVRLEDTILVTQGGHERLTTIDKARPLFLQERK